MDSKASRNKSQTHDKSLRARHELLDLETREAHLGLMKDAGKMLLRERTVGLLLTVLLTLTVVGLEIALFVVSPMLFPFSLALVTAAVWRLIARERPKNEGQEKDP